MRISVDGFVASPNGQEEWNVKPDMKLFQLINDLADSSDTLLLGRKMAEGFVSHFESTDAGSPRYAFAQKMVNIPKVIFSKTLNKPFGKNTIVSNGDLAEEVKKLKNQSGKDILVYGGAGFVSSLIAGGLIDEFYFMVIPVMINKGLRIFDALSKRQNLSLVSAIPYENGVTVLRYRLNND